MSLKKPENMSPELASIWESYTKTNQDINNQHFKDLARVGVGALVSGASALPIFNIPYVGTGIGGGLFETGNAIMQGKKAKDIAKDAGKGFIIGETVGAIPYAGKFAGKTKAGQAVVNQASNFANRLAETKIGQKVAEIAPKVEDVLMTDIKAFNPNKQTAYHGSPYDFNKFSNEAIGTGEGAQAHGMGHYAAKNKNIGEKYRENITTLKQITDTNNPRNKYIDLKNTINNMEELKKKGTNNPIVDEVLDEAKLKMAELQKNYKPEQYLNDSTGQLYKLSIPKDDVMLREDLPINQQSQYVQSAINEINKKLGLGSYDDLYKQGADISDQIKALYANENIDLNKLRGLEAIQDDIQRKLRLLNPEITGKTYYSNINNNSDLLNQHGIKGISYNGGIDGEARVMFNPADIEIIRKYYNQPSLSEILNKKTNKGAFINALLQD